MAVVYLPEDPRFKAYGEGLGNLLGSYLDSRLRKKYGPQIDAISTDDSLTPEQKVTKIRAVAGDYGLKYAKEQQDVASPFRKALEENVGIKAKEQEIKKSVVDTAKTEQETQFQAREEPGKLAKQAADLKATQADTLKAQADAIEAKARTAVLPAQKDALEAEAADRRAAAAKTTQDAEQQKLANDMARNALARNAKDPNVSPLAGLPDDIWRQLPDSVKGVALSEITSGNPKGAQEAISKEIARDRPKAFSDQTAKVVNTASTVANSAEDVLKGIDAGTLDPKEASSGSLKAWVQSQLVEKGIEPGTPAFNQQLAAQHQLLINSVQAGGGFGGEWKVRLGNKTIPNVVQGPAFQVVETNMILKDRMAELQREKERFEGTDINTKPIDAAIAQIKPLLDVTESMKGDQYGTLYYKGAAVDPKTLRSIPGREEQLDPEQKFKTNHGVFSGAQINQQAYDQHLKPSTVLKALGDLDANAQ